MTYRLGLDFAQTRDRDDPLARFRAEFHLPKQANGADEIYFCGNSLGLQPRRTQAFVIEELEKWRCLGVRGHFESRYPWMPYHEFLTAETAGLAGAEPLEVVTMNSLTVNLHLMMASFYRPSAVRHKILIEKHAFPSDHYAVESQIRFHGFDPARSLLLAVPRPGEDCL
ncbi:MAG: kynureninase, partial [Gammaproteobacteria bacterium]